MMSTSERHIRRSFLPIPAGYEATPTGLSRLPVSTRERSVIILFMDLRYVGLNHDPGSHADNIPRLVHHVEGRFDSDALEVEPVFFFDKCCSFAHPECRQSVRVHLEKKMARETQIQSRTSFGQAVRVRYSL